MRERPDELRPDPAAGAAPEPSEALAALVAKLRTELAGVRTAMRNRAVIEQAKGVLVERLGITPDQAFDHLVKLSQRANVKLVEVAASVVGATAPDPQAPPVASPRGKKPQARGRSDRPAAAGRGDGRAAPGRGDGRAAPSRPAGAPARPRARTRPPAHEALQAQHQLISSRIAASSTFDEAAEAIGAAAAAWPPPATVVITLLEPAGAHRSVGTYGINVYKRSAWRHVPPQFDVPIVQATRDRTALLITDAETLAERFPAMVDGYGSQAVFAAPLLDGDRVIGSLGLSWDEPIDLDADARRYLSALALPVARKAAELADQVPAQTPDAHPGEDSAAWLPVVLETVPDPAAVLAPVREDGRVVDFRIEHANGPAAELITPARAGEDATLLTVYPQVGSELLLPGLVELLNAGGSRRLGPARLGPDKRGGVPTARVLTAHAAQAWDRVVLVWRVYDESELIHSQLLDAERIARIGSFHWDLGNDRPHCSPQLYRMYFGDEEPHPVEADELARCVHEADLPAVLDVVQRTLTGGDQLSWEFRGAGRVAGRRLRIVAEPELVDGTVAAIQGTIQDVTDERAIENRLRLAEEALTAQRRRVDAELRAAQALQRALLPGEPELGATEGLWVSGRSRNSADLTRVDGDWYDACALPDGASLLVVGDVAGSGLAAMTTAARLRYAVRAYAALDMSPGEILASVNTMLCALEPERTATLVVARYEAREHRLRWAAAGQAAPVRYRQDGGAELLPGPLGLPVGVVNQVTYEDSSLEVAPGDRLLLYTDSLVGGRGTDLVGAIEVLLGAGAHAGRDDVRAVVSHVVDSLQVGPDADMGAMLVRVTS